jgi:alpha-D-ribose 1-methylphosphonate 5-triphosphate synthase subunit PhnH
MCWLRKTFKEHSLKVWLSLRASLFLTEWKEMGKWALVSNKLLSLSPLQLSLLFYPPRVEGFPVFSIHM